MLKRLLPILLAVSFLAIVLIIWTPSLRIATIRWTDQKQQIDGFGASSADFLDSLTPAQADFFFTTSGIGLSILRTQVIPDAQTCDAEFHAGGCSESNGQILNGELESAKLAVARGAIVIATPWSPPGAYKNNGSFKNGGYLLPSHYSDWAKEIASYAVMMSHNGVPLYAVSVQNEPNTTTDYGSCTYNPTQMHDFIPYLYSALQAADVGSTKIIIGEQSSWRFNLISKAVADPRVMADVGIIAAHGYGGSIGPHATGSVRLWETEDSSPSPTYDGSMADGLAWAHSIHDYLTKANVNAWLWWFLTDMPRQGEGQDNSALTDINGNFPKRAYVTGQWSKFVRPGWYRIAVSYWGPLDISAFKDDAHRNFAIVISNPTTKPVSQTFSLSGFSTGSLAPWVTSATLSLAPQQSIPISGNHFTYTLPPLSVTTFVGTASSQN